MADLCIHEMDPAHCSICLHGPTPRVEQGSTSLCRSCHADIIWVVTEKGKRMPIDAEPGGEGARFRKEKVAPNGDKIVHFVKDSEMEANTAKLYNSHFVTCEFADQHRKSR